MSNNTSTSFPASRQDLSNLKQTAITAANDLGETAATHAATAKGQLKDLSGHVREEGSQKLTEVKGSLGELVSCAQAYASERPLACIGAALAIGFLFGISRRLGARS